MQTSYEAPELLRRLTSLLPPEAATDAPVLTAAGILEPAAGRSYDALVAVVAPAETARMAEIAEKARALLTGTGRLAIAVPPGDSARELTIALSEAGFVILKAESLDSTGSSPALFLARKEPFFVRPYSEGDEERILPFFRSSFYVDRTVERWAWEYRQNPYGNLAISEAFAENGALVAHYAGYPVRFHREIGGKTETLAAYQIGDTMTAPSFRHIGRGPTSLLARTVRHFYALYCEGKVAFNYGFNTGNIQRFSMSFVGARRIEDLPFRVRPLSSPNEPLAPPRPLLTRLAGYRFERITGFDERWDRLFRRVSGSYRMLIERDARYLSWRYGACPDPVYFLYAVFRRRELVGWSVFRQKEDRLVWGDALFDPRYPEAFRLLLARVLAEPAHQGSRTIETWAADRPAWWSRWIEAAGFERRPEPDGLGLVFVPFVRDPEADFRTHLYYTMGDSDLF